MKFIQHKHHRIIEHYPTYNADRDKKNILKTECKFVRHRLASRKNKDTHYICLVHHMKDGSKLKELRLLKDYKRPLWITRKDKRKYKQKKEFENVDNCVKYLCTQSEIDDTAAKALELSGIPDYYKRNLIKDSPYVYGYDVSSKSIISHFYKRFNDNLITEYKVLDLDIEKDISGKLDYKITVITLSTLGFSHVAVLRDMYKGKFNTDEQIEKAIRDKSEELKEESKTLDQCKEFSISIHDNDIDLVRYIFNIAHKMKPDFMTIFNLRYDIPQILERLETESVDPIDVLCDPNIPRGDRFFEYKEGSVKSFKKGKTSGKSMEEIWSTVDLSATFMILDRMTMFNALRNAQGKLVGGYSFANILAKNGIGGKLEYEDENTIHLPSDKKHMYMTNHKPVEYAVYGRMDTVRMTDLELKTTDFSFSLPINAGITDYNRYNSSAQQAIDRAYSENIDDGLIIATTPRNSQDWSILGTNDWIKTLPSPFIQNIGLTNMTTCTGLTTNITTNADDIDCVSSYPSDIMAGNISAGTTIAELISVGDLPKQFFKDRNINYISSNANTVEYATQVLKLPNQIDMIKLVNTKLKTSINNAYDDIDKFINNENKNIA